MAACTFYQNPLWPSSKTTEKRCKKTAKDIKLYKEKDLLSCAFLPKDTSFLFGTISDAMQSAAEMHVVIPVLFTQNTIICQWCVDAGISEQCRSAGK